MLQIPEISFIMPNSISPYGAGFDGTSFYVFDGLCPDVYIFDRSGNYIERCRTLRTYRTANYSEENGRFCCLGGGCRGQIYVTDSRLRELFSVTPEYQTDDDRTNTYDARYSPNGKGFDVTHGLSLTSYFTDGGFSNTVLKSVSSRTFLNWADYSTHRAIYYTENGRKYISADRKAMPIPDNTRLVAFFPDGEELYGLFNRCYLYNTVERII